VSEIDWGKATEYAQRLEEAEKKRREKGKLFDPKKLVEDARKLVTIEDEELGLINYGHLTTEDLLDIGKEACKEKRSMMIVQKMLSKAYPDVTLDDVLNMPFSASTRLLEMFSRDSYFLQMQRKSTTGSTSTRKRSKSASSPTSTATP
jgi:NADH dehydrogenase/NADH:ubiquinone oxidoreductase subunit G